MLELALTIQNLVTADLKKRLQEATKAHAGALASAGFRLKQLTTTGMKQQAPGGAAWPAASPWVQYGASLRGRAAAQQRRLDKRKRAPKKPPPALYATKSRTPLGKLAGAARYVKVASGDTTIVRMGFLSPRLAELAAYHSRAHDVPVTARMRRLIFAVGLGISKSSLHIPARPAVGPVYSKFQGAVVDFAQARIRAAWGGSDPKSVQPNF